jgi:hypothetical protein
MVPLLVRDYPLKVGLLEPFVQPVEHCLDVSVQWAKLRGASWEA